MHHAVTVRWFAAQSESATFVFCRQTQMGLFRLLTTEAIVGPQVLTQDECWALYDRWVLGGKAIFLGEPLTQEMAWRPRCSANLPSPKTWADTYLAAFAQAAGLTLVTFDRALAARVAGGVLLGEEW